MKRKLYLFLMVVLCLFSLTACGEKKDSGAEYDETTIEEVARRAVDEWNAQKENYAQYVTEENVENTRQGLESYGADAETIISNIQSWETVEEEIGALKELKEGVSFSDNEDKSLVNVKLHALCENGEMYVTVPVMKEAALDSESAQYDILSVKLEEIQSMGQKMEKAGLNTLMGIGLVFILLIVISLLISLFIIINKMGNKAETAKAVPAAPVAPAAPVVETAAEDVTDDAEIVAVITAAIMASMGEEAPADGLVVRSIKRRKTNKWQNA